MNVIWPLIIVVVGTTIDSLVISQITPLHHETPQIWPFNAFGFARTRMALSSRIILSNTCCKKEYITDSITSWMITETTDSAERTKR